MCALSSRRSAWPLLMALILANSAPAFSSQVSLKDMLVKQKQAAAPQLDIRPRIAGGIEVEPGEFPFLVSIDDRCAGSIIAPQYILTSASCVENYYSHEHDWMTCDVKSIDVKVGGHVRGRGRRVKVQSLKLHERFAKVKDDNSSVVTRHNDIALLKTEEVMYKVDEDNKVTWAVAEEVGPVELNCDPIPLAANMTVVGWGGYDLADGRPVPSVVPLKLKVAHLKRKICECALSEHGIAPNEDNICASPPVSFVGTPCGGDLGAPLVKKNDDGDYELVGVTSLFSHKCIKDKIPAIYTDVSKYTTWILENQTS